MKKVLGAIAAYLKDWKNWVMHALIGVAILVIAFFIPVEPIYRILLLVAVVGFNVVRMIVSKKKKEKTSVESGNSTE